MPFQLFFVAASNQRVLIAIPPFTQLNTPYPSTAYLKGFLNALGVHAAQADLGIAVILRLFSAGGLADMFAAVSAQKRQPSANARHILHLKDSYIATIEPVMAFLQEQNSMLAHLICTGNYLPEAGRFAQMADLEWAFGTMGIRDKARHLATLYLEDLADLIKEMLDPFFGFSRYAERLGRSAGSFDELYEALQSDTYIDSILQTVLQEKITDAQPTLVALSVPFPGNLYSALKCGQWVKRHFPHIKVCLGGGYANTELRSLQEDRVFEFVDFITLDDGEAPLHNLLEYLDGKRPLPLLKRTFVFCEKRVQYINDSPQPDYKQKDVGTPDYSGLPLDKYLSVIEIANPMHRLWSDGRWNKLTLAHGCYWGKCTFCDISLDYIKVYEAASAKILVDRIAEMAANTGQRGFHFVDEAAPPALMREVALELLRRKLTIVWWTNIRFEKSFTRDLCLLLAASGCVAVSGGLEVASDRLLALIDKGVTVRQVTQVAAHFTEAGIMVHAYLMYGFPTQTAQETIDSLEVVRQLFQSGVVQSGFWHQFAMTAHSPVGVNPASFGVKNLSTVPGRFANNDLEHVDVANDHSRFGDGLKKSLFNYMHGICFGFRLQDWFDFKVPKTTINPNLVAQILESLEVKDPKPTDKLLWIGGAVQFKKQQLVKKGKTIDNSLLVVHGKKGVTKIEVDTAHGQWLARHLPLIEPHLPTVLRVQDWQKDYEATCGPGFYDFAVSEPFLQLREIGLLVL
ncbi:MAG: radical SAM protein [Edaphocola sp.]